MIQIAGVIRHGRSRPAGARRIVAYVLAGVSVCVSLASFAVRGALIGPARVAHLLSTRGQEAAVQGIIVGHHLLWAMADSSAIAAVLVYMLGAPAGLAYVLVAFGTALVLAQRPSAYTIPELLAAGEEARQRMGLA